MNKSANESLPTNKSGFLFLVVLLLCTCSASGCGKFSPAAHQSGLPSTPVLQPAGTYTAGQNDIPYGKYLLVELWTDSDGHSTKSGACGVPVASDYPMYDIQNGKLESFLKVLPDSSAGDAGQPDLPKVVGFMGNGSSNSGEMGIGASSGLTIIVDLPYAPEGSFLTIFSVAADGTIVVQIGSQVYQMKAGQRWVNYYVSYPDPHCRAVATTTFTNYGLLDASNMYFSDTPLAPEPTPTP